MIRTQIQLDEKQSRRLKALAAHHDLSMAEIIRRAVDEYIAQAKIPDVADRRKRARAAAGRFRSRAGDVAAKHDRYLAEDFGR